MATSCFAIDLPDFTPLVEKTSPAVVSIISFDEDDGKPKLVPEELRDDLEGTPLMEVLREIYGDELEDKLAGIDEPGLGSGSIISEDGYIITNYHVVSGAVRIYVQLKNREEYPAQVIGYDEGTDLALLKINGKNLPMINFAQEPVKVGQWVLAIGAPFGFEDTVTVGVVSAKRRSLGTEKYVPFIQTDVAINPGNSGGPLINLNGEMVGINAQIVSESGSYAGLSFAVPVDIIQSVIKQIKTTGRVERGWVGVAFQDLNRDLADSFGLRKPSGALVSKVIMKSPAQKAGLEIGDVIVKLNDKEIRKASDVPPVIGLLPIGSKVSVEVIRHRKPLKLQITLEHSPSGMAKRHMAITLPRHLPADGGIRVRNMNDEQDSALSKAVKGVVVVKLESTPWRYSGLRQGDIIMRLNKTEIHSTRQFYKELSSLPRNKSFSLLVTRDGEIQRYVAVKLP